MKILKNRKTAIALTVVIAVIALLFGVRRSINAGTAKVESMFYNDVYMTDTQTGKRYLQPSIDSQLKKREQSAYALVTIAENYPGLDDWINEVMGLRDMLTHAARISDKGQANAALQEAFDSLYGALLAASPDERDLELAEGYVATFEGARATIEDSRYNDEAHRFLESIGFPADLLRRLVLASEPEMF